MEACLPGRFQLDFYGHFEGASGVSTKYLGEQIELRYALANWGRLPANPTLYLEYQNNHPSDVPHVLEGKLLFGDELRRGWQWGANLSYEQELGGAKDIEREITFGISKTILDQKFSVGAELVFQHLTSHDDAPQNVLLIGPSLQWRPNKTVHMDVAPLFGATHAAPTSQIFLVLGVNLCQGEKGMEAPISARPH